MASSAVWVFSTLQTLPEQRLSKARWSESPFQPKDVVAVLRESLPAIVVRVALECDCCSKKAHLSPVLQKNGCEPSSGHKDLSLKQLGLLSAESAFIHAPAKLSQANATPPGRRPPTGTPDSANGPKREPTTYLPHDLVHDLGHL